MILSIHGWRIVSKLYDTNRVLGLRWEHEPYTYTSSEKLNPIDAFNICIVHFVRNRHTAHNLKVIPNSSIVYNSTWRAFELITPIWAFYPSITAELFNEAVTTGTLELINCTICLTFVPCAHQLAINAITEEKIDWTSYYFFILHSCIVSLTLHIIRALLGDREHIRNYFLSVYVCVSWVQK